MIAINPAVLSPAPDRKALIAGVLIASDGISNTFPAPGGWHAPRRRTQMSKDKDAVGRNYSVCARYRLSPPPFTAKKENHLDVAREQPSNLVYMRRRDSLPYTIDKPEEPENKERVASARDFEQFMCAPYVSSRSLPFPPSLFPLDSNLSSLYARAFPIYLRRTRVRQFFVSLFWNKFTQTFAHLWPVNATDARKNGDIKFDGTFMKRKKKNARRAIGEFEVWQFFTCLFCFLNLNLLENSCEFNENVVFNGVACVPLSP